MILKRLQLGTTADAEPAGCATVYAGVMIRSMRAALLILLLLVQGTGNAWASLPALASTVAAEEQSEQGTMPCHDDVESAAAISCCDDGACCAAVCFGAAHGLAPAAARLLAESNARFEVHGSRPDPLPAHPQLLLRPPSPSAS